MKQIPDSVIAREITNTRTQLGVDFITGYLGFKRTVGEALENIAMYGKLADHHAKHGNTDRALANLDAVIANAVAAKIILKEN